MATRKRSKPVDNLFRQCVESLRAIGKPVTAMNAYREFERQFPEEFAAHEDRWKYHGASADFRASVRNDKSAESDGRQLALDFDLKGYLPVEVPLPASDDDLLVNREYKKVRELTVPEMNRYLKMLDVQIENDREQRKQFRKLRDAVVAVIGENSRLTVEDARKRKLAGK